VITHPFQPITRWVGAVRVNRLLFYFICMDEERYGRQRNMGPVAGSPNKPLPRGEAELRKFSVIVDKLW